MEEQLVTNHLPYPHLADANLRAYINWSAMHWEQDTGAALEINYDGDTTEGCSSHDTAGWDFELGDGISTIGAAEYTGSDGGLIAQVDFDRDPTTDEIIEFSMCINGRHDYTVRAAWYSPVRFDLRFIVAHEFGHVIGAGHTDNTVMATPLEDDTKWVGLWGDDMDFARDYYGIRSHETYFRELDPTDHSWGSEVSLGGATNLPSGPTIGRNSSGSYYVGRAEVGINRNVIRFRTTPYRADSDSSWTQYNWSQYTSHGAALAARTSDERWAGAFTRRNTLQGCNNRVRTFRTNSLFSSLTYNNPTDLCSNFGVALAYDDSSNRFVLAYVASGESDGSQQVGRIYMRTSSDGLFYPTGTEVQTNHFSDTAPQIACRKDGDCVLSFIEANTNQRFDQQVTFTVGTDNKVDLDTSTYSSQNWVYDSPSPSVSTQGTPHRTFILLGLTAWGSSGVDTFWSRYDDDFPVNAHSWVSLGESSILRARMAYNPDRKWSYVIYQD